MKGKYVCITKCFYDNTLWEVGDFLRWNKEDYPPDHFRLTEEEKQEKTEVDASVEELARETLRKELADLKIPYDNRWNNTNLEHALIIGKKERGIE